ncbi:MAG: histidine phosphatase family protein [bacterium]|nr:alpha-ribazole phosphatase [Deltaproteobacteria bacterium]MCP4905015.1 histidine phosphatase family protein [bacterium]
MIDRLGRLILIRHGETVGQSSIRYHGVTDVPLSDLGREQVHASRAHIGGETYEGVWASTLCRSWESARVVAPGHAIEIDSDFREIDFGRWEGLTIEEIAALDPEFYADWQARRPGFEFPEGETRAAFRARVARGLERLRATGVESALIVVHKGVVRTILELAAGFSLERDQPVLGGVVHASKNSCGQWYTGRSGSDASCSEAPLGIPIESE